MGRYRRRWQFVLYGNGRKAVGLVCCNSRTKMGIEEGCPKVETTSREWCACMHEGMLSQVCPSRHQAGRQHMQQKGETGVHRTRTSCPTFSCLVTIILHRGWGIQVGQGREGRGKVQGCVCGGTRWGLGEEHKKVSGKAHCC